MFVVKGPDKATSVALDRLMNTSWDCVGAVTLVNAINEDDSERLVAVVEVSGVDHWVEVIGTDHKTELLV